VNIFVILVYFYAFRFWSNLLFVQILCAVFNSTYGTSILGIWKFLCKNSSILFFCGVTLVNLCVFFYKKVGCQTIKFLWKMGVNQKIGVKSYLLVKSATSCDLSACFLDSNFCVPILYVIRIINCPVPLSHKLWCQPFHTPVAYLTLT
jgi:hypothetical protein